MLELIGRESVTVTIVLPFAAFLCLGFIRLLHERPSEKLLNRTLAAVSFLHFSASLLAWSTGAADRLSGPLLLVASLLCAVVGHFSRPYLHRDPGYSRFFLFYFVFMGGISLLFTSTEIRPLVIAWELVGISSVLLIGFFSERERPAQNSLYALVTYRICDIALVAAALGWNHAPPAVIGALLVFASLGKSAQLPFSGWLPRAMEGPTPSSAIFYGALSLHAGAYLLLRFASLWSEAGLGPLVAAIGGATALYGGLIGRTRSDAKGLLAYAAMSQVGLIFLEIGLGFRDFATWHIVGHCFVRTLQMLRAPSLLHDFHVMGAGDHWPRRKSPALVTRWYGPLLAGLYLEAATRDWIGRPITAFARLLESSEEAWSRKLSTPVSDVKEKTWQRSTFGSSSQSR